MFEMQFLGQRVIGVILLFFRSALSIVALSSPFPPKFEQRWNIITMNAGFFIGILY